MLLGEEMVTAEAAKASPPKKAPAPAVVADLSDDEDEMLCPAKAPPAPAPRPPATPQAASAAALNAAPAGDAAEAPEKPSEKPKKGKTKEKAKPQPKAAEKPPAAPAEKAPQPAAPTAPAAPAAPATAVQPAEKEAAKVAAQPKVVAKAKSEAKGAKDVKKLSKDEMEVKVLEYMRQQNRPYNSQNVFDNLHGAVPKASVQAIMESLVAEGKLLLKEYGKIKVFLVSQTSVAGSEDASNLQQQVDEVSKKRKELHGSLDILRKEMSQVAAKHSAAKEAKESQAEAARLEEQAEKWRHAADGDRVDESEVRAVETQFAQVHQAWRKRKRLCMDTLSTLGEGMGIRTSQLVETYGVDTDEDCNQLMPQEFMQ